MRSPPQSDKSPEKLAVSSLLSSQMHSASDSDLLKEMEMGSTSKGKRRRLVSDVGNRGDFDSFKNEIRDMLNEILINQKKLEQDLKEVRVQNTAIKTANMEVERGLETISTQIKQIQMGISNLEGGYKDTTHQIAILESKLDLLDHYSRKTSIELRNVPRKDKESKNDLYAIIKNAFKNVGLSAVDNDIRDVYRIYNKTQKNSTIIAEMSNVLLRDTFLSAIKQIYKDKGEKFCTSHLGFSGASQPIYVSENPTNKIRKLFSLARNFCTKYKYRYCWMVNGKIMIRKEEGEPAVHLRNELHLVEYEEGLKK